MGEEKKTVTRYVYMDAVRILGCLLVVSLHMATAGADTFSPMSIEWAVSNVMDSFGMTGITFFFMISGALFLRRDADLSLKYVWKKIGVLFLVYEICLLGYSMVPFVRGWEAWTWYNIKVDIIDNVLKGTAMYHLGFPPTLMVLYALSPILKDAFASKKNCEYFLVIFAVLGAVIPFLLRFDFGFNTYLQSFYGRFGLGWITGHIGYFVLGHYLHDFVEKLSPKKCVAAVLTALGSILFTILCNHKDAVSKNEFSTIANTPLSITCFLFVACIYMLLKTWMAEYKSAKGIKVLKYLASLTFGIYLVHPLIINNVLNVIALDNVISNHVIWVLCRLLIVIGLSGIITALLKKVPIVRRLI